jgi:hypothetical protein
MPFWLKRSRQISKSWLLQAMLAAGSLVILIGCMSKPAAREDETTTDMRHISGVFEAMQGFHNRPPKSMDEIRNMLADLHKDGRNEEPEKVLTSSRDNQPYVIVLGAKMGDDPKDALVIFEKTGKDGTRYAMTAGRHVLQLTDDQFKQAQIASGKRSDES